MQIFHTDLEYDLPMSRDYVERLIRRVGRSPATSENGEAFAVHPIDLREMVDILEQVASQMEPRA